MILSRLGYVPNLMKEKHPPPSQVYFWGMIPSLTKAVLVIIKLKLMVDSPFGLLSSWQKAKDIIACKMAH